VIASLVLTLALAAAQPEVVVQIQVHGNLLTSEEEVLRLAGIRVGMPFEAGTIESVTERLRAASRFASVEVLKRFASIADPTQVLLVILVDDGRVAVDWSTGEVSAPKGLLGRRGKRVMFVPILRYEDGYGVSYGVQLAVPNPAGARSRLAFPLTWGGEKRAAIELEKNMSRGPFTRILGRAGVSRRENPFFELDDDRRRFDVLAERRLGRSLRGGVQAGLERASFQGATESFGTFGAEVELDTRLDPFLSPNAIYGRMRWDRLAFESGPAARTSMEARAHVGVIGQSLFVARVLREDSNRSLPPNFKPLLGGMSNLRGFRAGYAAGDTLLAASGELRVPLTSPLNVGKLGVSAFMDLGTAYDKGARLEQQKFERAIGGSIWLLAAVLRFDLSIARGLGSGTRVQAGAGVTF
jgi:hypothetical protein